MDDCPARRGMSAWPSEMHFEQYSYPQWPHAVLRVQSGLKCLAHWRQPGRELLYVCAIPAEAISQLDSTRGGGPDTAHELDTWVIRQLDERMGMLDDCGNEEDMLTA